MSPQKFLERIVILCFKKRFSKQNSVIRLKSNNLATPNSWSGYVTAFDSMVCNKGYKAQDMGLVM